MITSLPQITVSDLETGTTGGEHGNSLDFSQRSLKILKLSSVLDGKSREVQLVGLDSDSDGLGLRLGLDQLDLDSDSSKWNRTRRIGLVLQHWYN